MFILKTKKALTNQGVTHVLLIIIGLILSAVLVGFFVSNKKLAEPAQTSNNPVSSIPNPPTYPNLPTSGLPAGCTDTSTFSVTTGEPCHPPVNFPSCGLTVLTPQPNQTISQGFVIKGVENGCGWTAFEAVAGTVQAYQSNGLPVSSRIPINISGNWMQIPVNFQVILNLNQIPPPGSSGSLVFMNDDTSGNNPKTATIPIKF
ncbi:MAG TPA: hypothetical protein VIH31_02020 [Candidatus Paceibacterota bacterium]